MNETDIEIEVYLIKLQNNESTDNIVTVEMTGSSQSQNSEHTINYNNLTIENNTTTSRLLPSIRNISNNNDNTALPFAMNADISISSSHMPSQVIDTINRISMVHIYI